MTKALSKLLEKLLIDDTTIRPKNWDDLSMEACALGIHLQRDHVRGEPAWYILDKDSELLAKRLLSEYKEAPRG